MRQSKMSYAGIGSRVTPGNILVTMQQIGKALALEGWTLRSGNCTGADQAFAKGANSVNPKLVELYLPWRSYEAGSVAIGNVVYMPSCEAYRIAAKYHPAWHKCSKAAQAMHARNVQIILGARLNKPVQQVICWTPGAKAIGVTALGIRIAQAWGIEVRNLAKECVVVEQKQTEFAW